jgi:hypothetical protein
MNALNPKNYENDNDTTDEVDEPEPQRRGRRLNLEHITGVSEDAGPALHGEG